MPDFKPIPKPQGMKKPSPRKREAVGKAPVKVVPPRMIEYQPRRARPVKVSPAQRYAGKAYRFMRKRGGAIISLGAAALLAVAVIGFLIWSLAGNNALAIYLGDEHFAYIAFSQEMTDTILTSEAVNRLQARENAQVLINEEITIRPASANQRDILPFNEAVERLAADLTFRLVGTAIEVDGERKAVLRSERDAEDLIWRLQSPFMQGHADDYYLVEFVEDFRTVSAPVMEEDIATIESALALLDGNVVMLTEYVVQSGDNLGSIALRHNTTLTQIYADNPNVTAATILRVGDILSVRSVQPYLSVRTVKLVTSSETIPIENDYHDNPVEPSTFREVLEEGAEGEVSVVTQVTRINGIITEQRQVSSQTIREMVPGIVIRGTG